MRHVECSDHPDHASGVVSFSSLDGDCLRAVAAALSSAVVDALSLDRRSSSVLSLSRTCRSTRCALSDVMAAMQRLHNERLGELASICTRLGTSWDAMRAAHKLFNAPGTSTCASCGEENPNLHGSFVRSIIPRSSRVASAEENEESELGGELMQLLHGRCYCAHCWRAGFALSMRPTAGGVEQMWDAPIEEGSWRLVQDFSHCSLDSPLLAREEFSEAWDFASELADEIGASGYALIGTAHSLTSAARSLAVQAVRRSLGEPVEEGPLGLRSEWANSLPSEERWALVTWNERNSQLLADLLASGYADHLLSLELSACGLDDLGLSLLSEALVGNALFVRCMRRPVSRQHALQCVRPKASQHRAAPSAPFARA